MSKFKITKHLDMAFLGKGWEKAYIDFTPFTGDEIIELTKLDVGNDTAAQEKNLQAMVKLLQAHFLEGKGYVGEAELAPIEKNDLGELVLQIFPRVIQLMRGQVADENFSMNSAPQS